MTSQLTTSQEQADRKPASRQEGQATADPRVDVEQRVFDHVAASAPFQELVRRRSTFVRVTLTASILWFGAFLLLIAFAPEVMGAVVAPGLTLAYLFGFSQFVLVWLVTWAYIRTSDRVFVPLQERALAVAEEVATR